MTVQEIHNIWKEQWQNEQVRYHGKYGFPEILYEIRESNRSWTNDEIGVFSDYLNQVDKKWFVANLFALQEKLPKQLFESFIDAGISEPDPSQNADYINPCLRVFGFERVFDLLDNKFQNGDNQVKIGVCKLYYWARTPLVNVKSGNKPFEIKGYLTKWNGHYYGDYDWDNGVHFEMNESEVANCKEIESKLMIKRRRFLMEEFLKNHDVDVRYQIKLALPDKLSSYPNENRELATDYFRALKREYVPDNYSDLMLQKNAGIFRNSRIIRFLLKWRNVHKKKKEIITLKNK
ncbi:MAG TPA: hypothetical protein VLZ75_07370 [Chitinophagales bacterium]|nr:hypothetical protein [Chitinophagales bacterium]